MEENTRVSWVVRDCPWELEDVLIASLDLPLNLEGNSRNRLHPELVAGVVDSLGQEAYRRIMENQQPLGPLGPDGAVTHILVVTDPARSRDFWVGVLGAELYREYGGTSVVLRFAGTWLLLVSGGGPTADKPTVVFQPPADADLVSHAMTLRVADCQAAYETLRSKGAAFLTPPHNWGSEIRCFLRDPDGHLVEISRQKPADSGM